MITNYIVHYSRAEPFRSITSAPKDEWPSIIKNLTGTNAWGLNRFADPAYLKQRIQAESFVRKAFIAKGGQPQLLQPIYFFLGRNLRFEENQLNKAYKINLEHILSQHVSFTYGDSMLGFVEENKNQSGIQYKNPLCGEVYRQEELGRVYSSSDFPADGALAIEAQLWIRPTDEIVEALTDF